MSDLDLYTQESQIEAIESGRWRCNLTSNWCVGKAVNGGYAMSIAAKAMAAEIPQPHPLAITGYYLDVTNPGEAEIQTEVIREGRNVSSVEGKLFQGDRECIRLLGSFTNLEKPSGETFLEEAPPELPDISECVPMTFEEAPVEINKQFDILVPKNYMAQRGTEGNISELRAWVKFKDTDNLSVFALCLLSDAFMPAVFNRVGPVAWVPTLELTVQVRGVPEPGYLRTRFRTRFLSNGNLEEDGEIWDQKGNLVAISRQMAKLRIPTKK